MRNCLICEEKLDDNCVEIGGCHIGCYESKIDVFFVALKPDFLSGYYEKDLKAIADMLTESDYDDAYLIQKRKVSAGFYKCLQDFEGF